MNKEEAYEELKYLTEENCRKNCDESGMCNDCYIDFEQVKAIDFIRNENIDLQQRIDNAVELISKELLCYDNESDEFNVGNKAISILKGENNESNIR